MGKARRHEKPSKKHGPYPSNKPSASNVKRRQHSQNGKLNTARKAAPAVTDSKQKKQPARIKVPFHRHDRVLLVGEGDFSFALSLMKNHEVGAVVATSYDDEATLVGKYPQIEHTLQLLREGEPARSYDTSIDDKAVQMEGEWNGFSANSDDEDELATKGDKFWARKITVLHGIDATSLAKSHKKTLNSRAPFTKIVFNFPHTGGLSTDVNRQVRANQELLVSFFNAAKPLLATKANPARSTTVSEEEDDGEDGFAEYAEDRDVTENHHQSLATGQVLVTLFEGEPYTLWNIRDLARHCGLQVVESFKFDWVAYPGYKHARTIGDITTGKDRSDEGKRKGAWRGEERDARCYVLRIKDEHAKPLRSDKRKRQDDSSGDE